MDIVLDKDHMATVYDPNGVAHVVSRLDAIEYLASGHYTVKDKDAEDGQVAAAEVKPADATKPEVTVANKTDRKAQIG